MESLSTGGEEKESLQSRISNIIKRSKDKDFSKILETIIFMIDISYSTQFPQRGDPSTPGNKTGMEYPVAKMIIEIIKDICSKNKANNASESAEVSDFLSNLVLMANKPNESSQSLIVTFGHDSKGTQVIPVKDIANLASIAEACYKRVSNGGKVSTPEGEVVFPEHSGAGTSTHRALQALATHHFMDKFRGSNERVRLYVLTDGKSSSSSLNLKGTTQVLKSSFPKIIIDIIAVTLKSPSRFESDSAGVELFALMVPMTCMGWVANYTAKRLKDMGYSKFFAIACSIPLLGHAFVWRHQPPRHPPPLPARLSHSLPRIDTDPEEGGCKAQGPLPVDQIFLPGDVLALPVAL